MNWMSTDILISEVGPRDGLQSIKSIMPTEVARRSLQIGVPKEAIYGIVPETDVPKGFEPATHWAS